VTTPKSHSAPESSRLYLPDATRGTSLNPKSPAFKAMGFKDRELTAAEALALMAKEPNLIKRPLVVAGGEMVAGFDRERLRALLA